MEIAKYDRCGRLLLFTVAMLFVLVSLGCTQSNKSKIVGSWKTQSVDNIDGSVQFILYKFYKEGLVSKKTGTVTDEQLSKHKNKLIGKYMFEDDNKRISITWDDGKLEKMNVSFPQKNKILLGKYEMERIR